jgi:hypothetical protein
VKRVFGVDLFFPDHPHDFVEQGAIFKDQQVRIENASLFGPHRFTDTALDFEDLVARLDEGFLEAINLLVQLGRGQLAGANGGPGVIDHDDSAAADSG